MNGTTINIDLLNLFAVVARHLNFRKAAIELAMPVGTLSRKISNLEENLGTQLLQRTTRSVKLTELGEQLLLDIAEPLQKINGAAEKVAHRQDSISGLVRIATTFTLAETNIIPVLQSLREKWPQIRVQLMLSENVVDIRSERVDFAIRAGKLKDMSLIARKICTHRLVLYSTPKMQSRSDPGLVAYDEQLHDSTIPNIEVQDMRMVLDLVLANQGRAWMPDALCFNCEKKGMLVRIPEAGEKVFHIYLVFASKKFIPKRVRLVMDAIIEHANQFTGEINSAQSAP